MKKMLLLLWMTFYLVGCGKGPDESTIKKSIEQKLTQSFSEDVFEIQSFSRRGSYPYTKEGSPDQRLLIYFKAKIVFLKDYKLSDWNNLNVNSLVLILGATPQGVIGVNPDGNKKGDVLIVNGTSAYVYKDKTWQKEYYQSKGGKEETKSTLSSKYIYEMEEEEKVERRDTPLHNQYLQELQKIAKEFNRKREYENLALLEKDLKTLIKKAQFQSGKKRNWITLATGSPLGEYHALGKGLERILTNKRKRKIAKAYTSSGSSENCELIQAKMVLFAFTQNDIAAMAYNGTGLFKGKKPLNKLRALCSLYPEAVHIIAQKQSGIKSIKEFAGKKINTGAPGSGVKINAWQLLTVCGLEPNSFSELKENSIETAMQEFKDNKIDGLFVTSAYPSKVIQQLVSENSATLVPVNEDLRKILIKKHSFIPINISQNTYIGMDKNLATIGVTAMLLTHEDTPKEVVKEFLDKLFKNVSSLSKDSVQANYISRENAKYGVSIPFHPAAEEYFK